MSTRSHVDDVLPEPDATPRQTDLARLVHDALVHLDDLAYLQTHPLARTSSGPGGRGRWQAGHALREVLLDGIGSLRPNSRSGADSHAWRGYQILTLRYAERRDLDDIQATLAIGKSEYYRDHRRAVDALTSYLQERGSIGQPERASTERPPPRSTTASLPNANPRPTPRLSPMTTFLGRERELSEIRELLEKGARLVTLTGPGGVGKTRLALEAVDVVGRVRPDGVWIVELAVLTDPDSIPATVAIALGLREESGRPLIATVVDYLRDRRGLLVLDNCEHLVAVCASLAEYLLRACPGLQILATSREALGIPCEVSRRVPPMTTPDPELLHDGEDLVAALGRYDAVRLFVERAAASQPTFALTPRNAAMVGHVCRKLDGIPLAIELAAAWMTALTIEQINERLNDCLGFLIRGSRTAQSRHQTLRALLDWSYALLSEAEQHLLCCLSVFAGDFNLDAVEWVLGGNALVPGGDDEAPTAGHQVLPVLASLVDKSLVLIVEDGVEARFHLLEATRQYAAERLAEDGDAERIRARHRGWYVRLIRTADRELWSNRQGVWLSRLFTERHNLRSVLSWLREHDVASGLEQVAILWRFWWVRGFFSEGRRWLEAMLDRSTAGPSSLAPVRARAYCGAGFVAREQGDLEAAKHFGLEALKILSFCPNRRVEAMVYFNLAMVARAEGRAESDDLLGLSKELFEDVGDHWGEGEVRFAQATRARSTSDYASAEFLLEQGLTHLREVEDHWGIGWALGSKGNLSRLRGDHVRAVKLYAESLNHFQQAGDVWGAAWTTVYLANLHREQGEFDEALSFYRQSAAVFRQCGATWGAAYVECFVGVLAIARGDVDRGVRSIAAASTHPLFATSLAPDERNLVDASLASARESLDADAYAGAWEAGRRASELDVRGTAGHAVEHLAPATSWEAHGDLAARN